MAGAGVGVGFDAIGATATGVSVITICGRGTIGAVARGRGLTRRRSRAAKSSRVGRGVSGGVIIVGRANIAFGTGGGFPKVVFGVWRCVCVAGRLKRNGSISFTITTISLLCLCVNPLYHAIVIAYI